MAAVPRRTRVLLVDDHELFVESAKSVLAGDARFEVVGVAMTGPEAVALAGELTPDLVLMDIGLPGMDGYTLARELRALPQGAAPRIVAITGYGQPSDRDLSAAAGIDCHLVKPVDPAHLAQVLRGPPG